MTDEEQDIKEAEFFVEIYEAYMSGRFSPDDFIYGPDDIILAINWHSC